MFQFIIGNLFERQTERKMMEKFNLVNQKLRTNVDGKTVEISANFLLPAIEKKISRKLEDGTTIESTRAVVDPELSSQDIFETLQAQWDEKYLCEKMLSRFIAVLAMDPARKFMSECLADTENISIKDLSEKVQEFLDKSWNVNLSHPVTDKVTKKKVREEKLVQDHLASMSKEDLEKLLNSKK